jgi:hypothetical protein
MSGQAEKSLSQNFPVNFQYSSPEEQKFSQIISGIISI